MSDKKRQEQYDSQIAVRKANPDMPCKTCRFAGTMYNGRKLKAEDYDAGSCEKYDIKPHDVYFDAKPCSKYMKK